MRTIEIELYKFEELSAEAQKRTIQEYRYTYGTDSFLL